MPTVELEIAASGDDARISADDQVSYPGSATISNDAQDLASGLKSTLGGLFYLSVVVMRWDTSSIPDSATITSAVFRARGTEKADVDSRSITLEWYAFDGSVALSDWTSTVGTSAHTGRTIASLSDSADEDFTLLNPDSNINKTGYTGLRVHVSGSAPTANGNYWQFATFDNATLRAPRLIITHTGADPIRSQHLDFDYSR